jgi:arylformamidase
MPEWSLIDLSHPLRTGMPVFPEDPEVVLEPAGALAPWQVTRLGLGTHSGTHIDAASHYVPEGTTIDRYPLERFVLPAYVAPIRAEAGEEIHWPSLQSVLPTDLRGVGVLLYTGWDRHWGDERAVAHPYLGEDAAAGLVAHGVALVGTDALNVDATEGGTTHAHAALLGAGRASARPARPPVHLRLRAAAARRRRRLTHPRLRDRRR